MSGGVQPDDRPRLVVLGSGAIKCTADRQPPGYLLLLPGEGGSVLIDPGPGTLAALPRVGVEPVDLDLVLVSHGHLDHHLDLLGILFARHVPGYSGQEVPTLPVAGPPSFTQVLQGWGRIYGDWVRRPGWEFRPIPPGRHDLGCLELETCLTRHLDMEALALSLHLPGTRPLCYTGDSEPCPALTDLARGAGLFLCECSCPDDHPVPGHMTPGTAGRTAAEAGVDHLVLTHFYPTAAAGDPVGGAGAHFTGTITAARDGQVIPC